MSDQSQPSDDLADARKSEISPAADSIDSSPHPQPLSYESPRDHLARNPGPSVLAATFVTIFCFAFAVAFTAVAGAVFSMSLLGFESSKLANRPILWFVSATAFLLAIWFVACARQWFKNPDRKTLSRFALIGILLGFGVTLLLEGACFAISAMQ